MARKYVEECGDGIFGGCCLKVKVVPDFEYLDFKIKNIYHETFSASKLV